MLHYDEYGNKNNPTILLLHGAGALDTFCNQYCFSKQYHLIVPHLHGAEKSADIVYAPDMMKQELLDLIDSLHKKEIGIIGHSLGGQLAIMLVCERQNQFSFAVFLSAIRKHAMIAFDKTEKNGWKRSSNCPAVSLPMIL